MQNQTLFDRLGGAPALHVVVNNFYDKVLVDDVVKHFFQNTDMKKQRVQQETFLCMAFGGPNNYTGRDMKAAHAGMNCKNEHFDRIIQLLAQTLKEAGVSDELIKEVAETAEPMREDIVEA